MAEINGLLNRRTTLKLYRGFESLPHRKRLWIPEVFFFVIKFFSEINRMSDTKKGVIVKNGKYLVVRSGTM